MKETESIDAVKLLSEDDVLNANEKNSYGTLANDIKVKTLHRTLTFWQCFAFVVGGLIGSGIYVAPALVSKRTPNSFVSIMIWIIAGCISLFGALCYTELVSVVQKTGSTYIFVHEAYGRFASFFIMMTVIGILMPTAGNVMILIIGNYFTTLFIENQDSTEFIWAARLFGLLFFYIFAIISCFGVSTSGRMQIVLNVFQMSILSMFVVTCLYSLIKTGNKTNLDFSVMTNNTINGILEDIPSIGSALFSALFCFDGWYMIALFVEEIVNPKRNIPLLAVTGIPCVTLIYAIVNVMSLTVLSHEEMGSSVVVFSAVLGNIGGNFFRKIMPILVVISTGSTVLGFLYHSSRFVLSAAREGQFPRIFSLIHSEKRSPILGILYITIAATLSTFIGLDLEKVLHYSNAAIWIEYCIAFSTVIYFRYKFPLKERAYKVWITTPFIMMAISMLLIILMFIQTPFSALFFGCFAIASALVYYMLIYKDYGKYCRAERLANWFTINTKLRYCKVNEMDI